MGENNQNIIFEPAIPTLEKFFMTDVICKSSSTMAKCVQFLKNL